MSFGKMNQRIELEMTQRGKDVDGFPTETKVLISRIRASIETKHGNEKWANLSTFSTATALFRFRRIPQVEVTTSMSIKHNDTCYQILSVENVRQRGMYIEVLAEKMEGSQNG